MYHIPSYPIMPSCLARLWAEVSYQSMRPQPEVAVMFDDLNLVSLKSKKDLGVFAFTIYEMTLMFRYIFCSNVRDLGCFLFQKHISWDSKVALFLGATINKKIRTSRQQAAFASACSLFFNRGTEGKGFSDDWPWNMLTFWKWIKNNVAGV